MRTSFRSLLAVLAVCMLAAFVTEPSADVTPMQQLYMLKELKPDVERVGIVWNKEKASEDELTAIRRAATSLQVQLFLAEITELSDLAPQFRNLARTHKIQGLWVVKNDGIVDSSTGRSFLVKESMKSGIAVLAPDKDWVDAGATVALKKTDDGLHLMVNQTAVNALSMAVPEKYLERTEFLAAN